MIAYLLRRLLWIALTTLCVSMLTFGLIFATGDPAVMLVPTRNNEPPDPALVEQVRRERGFDKPIPVQYANYLLRLVQGDLGYSFQMRRPANEVLFEKLPNTALLAASILLAAIVLGIPLGLIAALHHNRLLDRAILLWNTVAIAVPPFLLGLVLIYLLAFQFKLLPFNGAGSLRHLVMPVLSVALPTAASYAIFLRTNLLNQVTADYVRTAHAKGVRGQIVALRHMLPNALVPVVTLASLDLAFLLTGIVIVEQVFGYPGMGAQVLQAVKNKDIPVVMGAVLYGTVLIGFGNLLADLLAARLDPRIRLGE
jgi:peptide/nickel transport system permease protein